jgi:hypothetical protein
VSDLQREGVKTENLYAKLGEIRIKRERVRERERARAPTFFSFVLFPVFFFFFFFFLTEGCETRLFTYIAKEK